MKKRHSAEQDVARLREADVELGLHFAVCDAPDTESEDRLIHLADRSTSDLQPLAATDRPRYGNRRSTGIYG